MGRHKHRAVKHIKRDRAGGNLGFEPLEAVRATDIRRLDRRFSDDVDDARCDEFGYAFAGELQLLDGDRVVVSRNLKKPDLPLSMRAPDDARDPCRQRRAWPAWRSSPDAFSSAWNRPSLLPERQGRARQHQLSAGRSLPAGKAQEAEKQRRRKADLSSEV